MIQTSTLDNGLKIVTENLPGKRLADLCILVGAGARHEANEGGVAHAVEHCVFNGTTNRDKEKITAEIEKRGGNINAFTSLEDTQYTALVFKEDLDETLSIMADMMQNPTFDKKETAREKRVIYQEIKENSDELSSLLCEAELKAAYGTQSITHSVGGRLKQITQLNAEKLHAYMDEHYTASNMIVSVSGDINHDSFVQKCQHEFSSLKTGKPVKVEPAVYKGGCKVFGRLLEQLRVNIGFKGYSHTHPDRYAARIAADVLGGGFSSKLCREIRDKRGLVYDICTAMDSFRDTGLLTVSLSSSPKQIKEAIPVICEEILNFSYSLTDAELQQSKKQYMCGLIMDSEKGTNQAVENAERLLRRGVIKPAEEDFKTVEAVTKEDVIRVAHEMFSSKPAMAAVGFARELLPYDKLCDYLGYDQSRESCTRVVKDSRIAQLKTAAHMSNSHTRC